MRGGGSRHRSDIAKLMEAGAVVEVK